MATEASLKTRDLVQSVQRTEPAKIARERAVHYAVTEQKGSLPAIQLPPDFAERVREAKIRLTPGFDEGLEITDQLIEDWKQSL